MPKNDLEILAANFAPHHRTSLDKVFEGYWGLQFVGGAGMSLSIDGRPYELEGQWMWCSYPGPRFIYGPMEKYGYWSHRYITFRGPRAERWVEDGLLPFPPQSVPASSDFGARLDYLRSILDEGNSLSFLSAANQLERIILDLAEARSQETAPPKWLQELIRTMNNASANQPDYDSIAAENCMSLATMRRRFKEFAGVPIHTYLLRRRIHQACDLLIHTDLPIKVIAESLGYRDIYFFSRQFSQIAGMPPSHFRRGG
jgi:AraC-like DNA-binding protein